MSSKTLHNARMRQLHAALATRGLMDSKRDIIAEATNGHTDRASALSLSELTAVIERVNGKPGTSAPREGDRQRRYIISMAHELGWKTEDGRADMQRINAWCEQYGKYHKPLNDHDTTELSIIIDQFQKAYTHHLTKPRP